MSWGEPPARPVRLPWVRSLRAKTLGIVTLTLLALLCVQWLLLSMIAERGFSNLERQQMNADVGRVQGALAADIEQLTVSTGDYSYWDDTYAFVVGQNPAYIENNLFDQSFVNLKLNTVIIADITGHIVFDKAVDLQQGHEVQMPAALRRVVVPGSPLLQHQGVDDVVGGLVALPEGLLLLVARPIVTSQSEGPPRGTLIFGRYLNASKQQQLASLTRLPFTLWSLDDAALPHSATAAQAALQQPGSVQIDLLAGDLVGGYTVLTDIWQKPVALLRVETPRSVSQQGRRVIAITAVSLAVAGLVFAAVVLLMLERTVLRRLTRLSTSVAAIGTNSDASSRVAVRGDDELARLGGTINTMLAALEQGQAERLEALEERARMERERVAINAKRDLLATVSHEMRTPLTPIRGYIDLL
ncbi:MAG: HAMP domain-containing protein, partial [Chloroflexales bacterium]|nr:HAMP domain-containing protein [Chloroflexales bacterium]